MVRNYRKKTQPTYTLDTLNIAVKEVRDGILNSYQASKQYNIPRTTIVDRVKLRRGVVKETRGRPTAINVKFEKRIATSLHIMEKNGFGLSSEEVIKLVTQYVEKNKLTTPFKEGAPGYEWFSGFRKRNNLSLKKPQAVEMSRKAACDPFIIKDYFDTLEEYIKTMDLQYSPDRIWNLDESSFSKDPEKTKIVGAKGYASTRTIASAGKDNVTVLFTVNAAGEKLPPLIIYRGKNIWDQWMSQNAYEGTCYAATKNGWIDAKVFEKYMLGTVLPHVSKESPCLIIYDGHSTHIQLHVLEKAKELGVEIIKLPSHASHLLQPLDLAVFKSMKVRWDAKILAWQRLNVGAKMQKHNFSEILGEVWKELDPKIIRNGFKKGGIFPLNKDVIPVEKYDAQAFKRFNEAKIKQVPTLYSLCSRQIIKTINKKCTSTIDNHKDNIIFHPNEIQLPGTSQGTPKIEILEDRYLNNEELVSFESLLLNTIKKADPTYKIKKRKVVQGSEVITHDDFLNRLRKNEAEKQKKEEEKRERKSKSEAKKNIKSKQKLPMPTTIKKCQKKIPKKIPKYSSDESSESDNIILSSDSDTSENWGTYCHKIIQQVEEESNISDHTSTELGLTSIQCHKIQPDKDHITNDEYEPDSSQRHPQVGDWIIVKFATKKTVKHFIGNVISLNHGHPQVKYLRKIKNSKIVSFHYPDVEDVSELIHDIDIVKFLENPLITRRGHVVFKEKFEGFNIQ
ncbi:uncharacterized protein LOC132901742 [Amyelois transitella]|uniref:uncharacterized protein LOC132901742 n=1 Tax=Amyelois transitella TaxID=680683 RepID=UPI00067C17A5|nr:uncharacterized protein LOC132901742 [Amyelois transitella]XP_060801975.1 uncharacterized protein LOC132901742 [Amyelois transitella]XP_060801976.1 uncharacterized protein LOC132901742 [Amyelois transitella]